MESIELLALLEPFNSLNFLFQLNKLKMLQSIPLDYVHFGYCVLEIEVFIYVPLFIFNLTVKVPYIDFYFNIHVDIEFQLFVIDSDFGIELFLHGLMLELFDFEYFVILYFYAQKQFVRCFVLDSRLWFQQGFGVLGWLLLVGLFGKFVGLDFGG